MVGAHLYLYGALEWTRTITPLGTGPQPAAYTIPPRGQKPLWVTHVILADTLCFVNPFFRQFIGSPVRAF
jgi:hypothetical protein